MARMIKKVLKRGAAARRSRKLKRKASKQRRRTQYANKTRGASRRKNSTKIMKKREKSRRLSSGQKPKQSVRAPALSQAPAPAPAPAPGFVIHNRMNETTGYPPSGVPPCPESSPVRDEDMASS